MGTHQAPMRMRDTSRATFPLPWYSGGGLGWGPLSRIFDRAVFHGATSPADNENVGWVYSPTVYFREETVGEYTHPAETHG
jgi:hypothetical protein